MNLSFFGGFQIMFFLMFILIFAVFFIVFFLIIKQWNHNHKSPRLSVKAKIVDKRQEFDNHHHQNNHTINAIYYYVTFEVESGDRIELNVDFHSFGMLITGDEGTLTFQGTRYLGFERMY